LTVDVVHIEQFRIEVAHPVEHIATVFVVRVREHLQLISVASRYPAVLRWTRPCSFNAHRNEGFGDRVLEPLTAESPAKR